MKVDNISVINGVDGNVDYEAMKVQFDAQYTANYEGALKSFLKKVETEVAEFKKILNGDPEVVFSNAAEWFFDTYGAQAPKHSKINIVEMTVGNLVTTGKIGMKDMKTVKEQFTEWLTDNTDKPGTDDARFFQTSKQGRDAGLWRAPQKAAQTA